MKSAYELAMERLEKEQGPSRKLTDEQKARIADIEKKYDAKVAEIRLKYEGQIATADLMRRETLQREMAEAIQAVETQREREKESVWNAGQ